ncbi:MAG: hypothetical protein WEB52_07115 [Dehalococcoidia bacterium]
MTAHYTAAVSADAAVDRLRNLNKTVRPIASDTRSLIRALLDDPAARLELLTTLLKDGGE